MAYEIWGTSRPSLGGVDRDKGPVGRNMDVVQNCGKSMLEQLQWKTCMMSTRRGKARKGKFIFQDKA